MNTRTGNVLLCGVGGQGVLLASEVLAGAAMAAGLARAFRLDTREAGFTTAQFRRQLGRRGAIGVAGRHGRDGGDKD